MGDFWIMGDCWTMGDFWIMGEFRIMGVFWTMGEFWIMGGFWIIGDFQHERDEEEQQQEEDKLCFQLDINCYITHYLIDNFCALLIWVIQTIFIYQKQIWNSITKVASSTVGAFFLEDGCVPSWNNVTTFL